MTLAKEGPSSPATLVQERPSNPMAGSFHDHFNLVGRFDQLGMQLRQHRSMAHPTVGESVKHDVVRPTSFDELGGHGETQTFAQANGMKTAARSTMHEGQALDSNPAELVSQTETSSPMKREGQADVETARTPLSEIFSPLDPFDVSICNAVLRNLRQRSNQFLVEDGKLPVDEAGGNDR